MVYMISSWRNRGIVFSLVRNMMLSIFFLFFSEVTSLPFKTTVSHQELLTSRAFQEKLWSQQHFLLLQEAERELFIYPM